MSDSLESSEVCPTCGRRCYEVEADDLNVPGAVLLLGILIGRADGRVHVTKRQVLEVKQMVLNRADNFKDGGWDFWLTPMTADHAMGADDA